MKRIEINLKELGLLTAGVALFGSICLAGLTAHAGPPQQNQQGSHPAKPGVGRGTIGDILNRLPQREGVNLTIDPHDFDDLKTWAGSIRLRMEEKLDEIRKIRPEQKVEEFRLLLNSVTKEADERGRESEKLLRISLNRALELDDLITQVGGQSEYEKRNAILQVYEGDLVTSDPVKNGERPGMVGLAIRWFNEEARFWADVEENTPADLTTKQKVPILWATYGLESAKHLQNLTRTMPTHVSAIITQFMVTKLLANDLSESDYGGREYLTDVIIPAKKLAAYLSTIDFGNLGDVQAIKIQNDSQREIDKWIKKLDGLAFVEKEKKLRDTYIESLKKAKAGKH